QRLDNAGLGGFGGGALAGGLLGVMMGNKKMRKMGGGMVAYGGAATAGALALKAYQNWQQGKPAATAPLATPADIPQVDQRFMPGPTPPASGMTIELAMIRAMIGAAKADGHMDAEEQKSIFEQVERMGLDAESKAFVFDALSRQVDMGE